MDHVILVPRHMEILQDAVKDHVRQAVEIVVMDHVA